MLFIWYPSVALLLVQSLSQANLPLKWQILYLFTSFPFSSIFVLITHHHVIFVFYFFVVSLICQTLLKFYYIYNWSWGELTSFQHFLFLSRCCSVAQSCLTLCSLMDCSLPGFLVLHCLPEFAQSHVHWVSNAIQPLHPLSPAFLLPLIFPSIRVFSSQSTLHVRWPEHWSFSICPSSVYSGLISFRIDWFDLLAVQGTLESLLQHHSPKASIPQGLPFVMVQLTSVHD